MKLKRKLRKKKRQLKEALAQLASSKAVVNELIMTLEAVKLSSTPQSRAVVFGENGIADKCQSEQTRAIVFMLRREFGLDRLTARQEGAKGNNSTDSKDSSTASAPVLPQEEADVLPSEQLKKEKTAYELEADLIQQARENGLKFQAAYEEKQRQTNETTTTTNSTLEHMYG